MAQEREKTGGMGIYLLVLFINAFVDLGHKITIQNTIFKMESGETQIILTALVNALILIPFILLVVPAGTLSDQRPKRWVMRQSAAVAVVVTLLITLSYYRGWFEWAFVLTLLLAMQSALFSPAKYGYLREQVSTPQLTRANGIVQAVTIIAILSGMFLFSLLFELLYANGAPQSSEAVIQQVAPLGWLLVLLASIEWWLTRALPDSPAPAAEAVPAKDLTQSTPIWRVLHNQPIIIFSIIGLSLFWGISQVSIAAFPAFAKAELGVESTLVIQGVLASAGVGILLGSLLVARISRSWIETGLIPFGAIGLTLALWLIPNSSSITTLSLLFLLSGLFGGLLLAPLNALIQYHAPTPQLGRTLAANNWMQNVTMLTFLAATMGIALLETRQPVDATLLFHTIALIAAAGTLVALWKMPQSLIRLLVRLLFRRRYQIHVDGLEQVPTEGGALLLGNHVSWIDWAMLQIISPRPIRFVMEQALYQQRWLRPFLDLVGVIPISSRRSRSALQQVREQLLAGELVCLFPEGAISHSGHLRPFRRGYEKAISGTGAPIIPFYLHGLWGSRFSRATPHKRHFSLHHLRKRTVHITFAEPQSDDLTAAELQSRVEQLSLKAWQLESERYPCLQHAWIRKAKQMGFRTALSDVVTGDRFSAIKLLIAATLISRRVESLSSNLRIGVLLPTTAAGVITNLAILLRGKCVVNLNYSASKEAIVDAIQLAGIDTLFTSARFLQKLEEKGKPVHDALGGVTVIELESIRSQITTAERLLTAARVVLLPSTLLQRSISVPSDIDHSAAILFSSGSEGNPKGIPLSHRNISCNIKQVVQMLQPKLHPRDHDTMLDSLPLFHSFGLTATTLMPLTEGIPLVTAPDPTDMITIANAIETHRATLYVATPTFLQWMSRNPKVKAAQLASLRRVVSGSEPLKQVVRGDFESKFGKPIYEGYGATEMSPVVSVNIPDETSESGALLQQGNSIGSVGRAVPGTLLRIVDQETLKPLPTGSDGLILIAGVQRMQGYIGRPASQQPFIEQSDLLWYSSGDKGHLDEAGFLTIVDRYARFAKIGGEMVSLSAVESLVRNAIETPIEAAAVAIPDLRKGEQVILFYRSELGEHDLSQQIRTAGINPLMIPASVSAIEGIPLLGSGKRNYALMKQWALEQKGQENPP